MARRSVPARVKIGDVIGQKFDRVAFGVDGDEQWLDRRRVLAPGVQRNRDILQLGWAERAADRNIGHDLGAGHGAHRGNQNIGWSWIHHATVFEGWRVPFIYSNQSRLQEFLRELSRRTRGAHIERQCAPMARTDFGYNSSIPQAIVWSIGAVPCRDSRQIGQACGAAPAIVREGIMPRIAAIAIVVLCMAMPVLAHGTSGDGSIGGFGPLFLLAVAVMFVLVLVVESRWRGRKLKREEGGK